MSGELTLAARLYDCYNSQDLEGLLAFVADAVDYPDGEHRLHGPEALRRYWTTQWARIRTHDEPVRFEVPDDDVFQVTVHQRVRNLAGRALSTGSYTHTWHTAGGRITRMDILPNKPTGTPDC